MLKVCMFRILSSFLLFLINLLLPPIIRPSPRFHKSHKSMVSYMAYNYWRSCHDCVSPSLLSLLPVISVTYRTLNEWTVTMSKCGNIVERNERTCKLYLYCWQWALVIFGWFFLAIFWDFFLGSLGTSKSSNVICWMMFKLFSLKYFYCMYVIDLHVYQVLHTKKSACQCDLN